MTARARLATAGIAAFVVCLLASVPAAVAVSWFLPASVQVSGVSGTLWRGAASSVTANRLHLADAHWRLSPLMLLLGRLSADVDARLGDGAARGTVAVGLGGGLRCSDCNYQGPLAALRPLVPALGTLEGTVDLALAAFETRDQWPVRAVGSARLSNVPVGARGQGAPPASFEAQMSADPVPDSGLVEATIHDAGGPLELNARLSVKPPGSFEFAGRARPRDGAPAEIVNALGALGRPASDGSTELSVSGTF